jgi:hypothetical protein
MHYDDTLSKEKTIERAANARPATRSQLEQSTAEGPRVRQPKTGTVFDQQLYQTRIVSKDINRPRFDLGKYTLVEVLDLKGHALMLANM